MHSIFVTGTAGSGKSLLTSTLTTWFQDKGTFTIPVNLDPGAVNLPYSPEVDVRDYVDIQDIMKSYQLGPNGALILASDLMATSLDKIQGDIDSTNPDIAIVDTPGQIELFAYRESGPYLVNNLGDGQRTVIFLFDPSLANSPINFVSISLLAASIYLRLKSPQVHVLSKKDISDAWKNVMLWSSQRERLEEALGKDTDDETYILGTRILKTLIGSGFGFELIPVSSVTNEGMVELSATLTRIMRGGEEVED